MFAPVDRAKTDFILRVAFRSEFHQQSRWSCRSDIVSPTGAHSAFSVLYTPMTATCIRDLGVPIHILSKTWFVDLERETDEVYVQV